jgi:hypothetical protein
MASVQTVRGMAELRFQQLQGMDRGDKDRIIAPPRASA